ncbi:MAG: hypothetical protein M3301_00305, partial [Chloroflexota bacterium]|nr:hypothetical protein [Chloroflexota bacterium]
MRDPQPAPAAFRQVLLRLRVVAVLVLASLTAACPGGGSENGRSSKARAGPGVGSAAVGARILGIPHSPLIGLADNRPETFHDPRFRATRITRVRVNVPFDDVSRPSRRPILDAYFQTAKAAGVEPLVSFFRSYRSRKLLPTPPQFRQHFRRFRKRYPWVRLFSTWNEANFPASQPTGLFPRRTAALYDVARRECSRGRCT